MADIRKRPRRRAPGLVPEALFEMTATCPTCNVAAPILWLDKLPFPKQPVALPDGHYVPIDFPVSCAKCDVDFSHRVPIKPRTTTYHLYGDEAARYVASHAVPNVATALYFFCLTLVGLHRDKVERVRKQILALKRQISPDRAPETWSLHFTEIMDSPPGDPKFNFVSKADKVAFARRLAAILRSARPALATFNISGSIVVPADGKERKRAIKHVNQELFALALISTLEQMRMRGATPRWTFDNIQDTTGGAKTEGWAQEVFLGLQDTRLWTWLSAGSAVLEPAFAPPGSHLLSEIADFISYAVARDFEKATRGETSELPSRLCGLGFYQAILGDGSVDYAWSRGLPLRRFYNLGAS